MRKGFVLLTTVILSLVALALVGGLLYMLTRTTSTTGMEKRYISAIEVTKGVSTYIMQAIDEGNLTCTDGICGDNSPIDLSSAGLSEVGDYKVTATVKKKVETPEGTIYTIEVITYNKNNPSEKSRVMFVYLTSSS